jgi:Tfp pilus assembly protein PilV
MVSKPYSTGFPANVTGIRNPRVRNLKPVGSTYMKCPRMISCQRRKGFSLLEVVISLGILTLSTLSILGLCIYSAKLGKQSEARSTALSIARSQIDRILSVSQSNRKIITDEPITLPADLKSQMPGADLSASYSIRSVTGTANLQQIEVTVKWRNATGGGGAPFTSVSAIKSISSTINLSYNPYNGTTPHDTETYFYTPPPPPTTTGSTSTTGTTSTTSTTGSTTDSSTTGSTTGSTAGDPSTTGSTSSTSSTTGSTSSSTGSTGGAPPPVGGFKPGGGSKWK